MPKKCTTEEFIKKARAIHGDKYDYSKVEYVNNSTKVTIICPEHGEFEQAPNKHLAGQNCPKCSRGNTKENFIKKARAIHGDKYDYSKVEYVNNETKVIVICPEHGEFLTTPKHHATKDATGCPECSKEAMALTPQEYLEKVNFIHNKRYLYPYIDKEYTCARDKITIICPEHGEFKQTAANHLYLKQGCPKCRGSKGENIIEVILQTLEVPYQTQYKISSEYGDFRVDFYIQYNNQSYIIEYNGQQHYEKVNYQTQEKFEYQLIRDENLKKYCKSNKIKLLEISYNTNNQERINLIRQFLKSDN